LTSDPEEGEMQVFKKSARRMKLIVASAAMCLIAIAVVFGSRGSTPAEEPVMAADDAVVADEAPVEPVKKAPARKARRTAAASATPAAKADASPVESKAAASAEKGESAALELVTVTGCLERDDDTFRLKDTEGMSAPKARSWKSGFLKKGAAKVEVVDASNRLRLGNHVGHRVSVTGTLYEKEMVASSMRMVSASCDK
jgi:hypothetical protein